MTTTTHRSNGDRGDRAAAVGRPSRPATVTGMVLTDRRDPALPARFGHSSEAGHGRHISTSEVAGWLAARARANPFEVEKIPFARLDGWRFHPTTGNLGHDSGRFFSVEGLAAAPTDHPEHGWRQPILVQAEVGVLGILAREFDGVLHFLLQAKPEPGNPGRVQLSPTVQATRSNYTGVHRGSRVAFAEHFLQPGRGRVLVDVLQSEHGSWFLRKANRNMVVEVTTELPEHPDFQWFTLGQIGELLHHDNVVNMDTRSVLACLPTVFAEAGARHPDRAVRAWLTAARAAHDLRVRLLPLRGVPEWAMQESALEPVTGAYARLVAVAVTATSREVSRWSQPLLEPLGPGEITFLVRRFDGVPHLLVQARAEPGLCHGVELAPSLQLPATPGEHATPPLLAALRQDHRHRVLYQAVHAEEGGRFYNAQSRYRFVELTGPVPEQIPHGYRWVTPGQLSALAQHGYYATVQARTLLACLVSGAVRW